MLQAGHTEFQSLLLLLFNGIWESHTKFTREHRVKPKPSRQLYSTFRKKIAFLAGKIVASEGVDLCPLNGSLASDVVKVEGEDPATPGSLI